MHVIVSALLFICALPTVNLPIAGCIFLLPILIFQLNKKNSSAVINGALLGGIIASYVFLGVWSYSITLYLLVIALVSLSFSLLIFSIIYIYRINMFLAFIVAPFMWLGSTLILNYLNMPVTLSVSLMPMNSLLLPASIGGQHLLDVLLIAFQIILLITFTSKANYFYRSLPPTLFIAGLLLLITIPNKGDYTNNLSEKINISAVQTNIHPLTTLAMPSEGNIESLHDTRLSIIKMISNQKDRTDIIIWPEVNFSKYEFRNKHNISELAKKYSFNMLVSSPDISPSGESFSSVFAVSEDGNILSRQSKRFLIPLIETDIYKDKIWKPHHLLPGKPGTLVCYESAFTLPSAKISLAGSGYLVITTNEAYAGPSVLPLIHLQLARLRAIETGKTVIRTANGGTSAIINNHGEITEQLPLFTEGILNKTINTNYTNTFYVEHFNSIQNIYISLSILAFISTMLLIILNRRSNTPSVSINIIKPISYSMLSVVLLLGVQYLFIKNTYTSNTNKIYPSSLIDFQNSFFQSKSTYKSMKASNTIESLTASMTFLLRDYGNNVTINKISPYFSLNNGLSSALTNIKTTANQYNYSINPINYIPDNKNITIATPCLALLTNGETVVIRKHSPTHTIIFSPYNEAELTLKTSSFIKKWTGQTITFSVNKKHWDI